jgi:U4/U6 small nuclear ribonucleoprotein PRP3
VTLKSFMRILANEAIEDPTAVEAQVRAQMEKRKISHEMHNESRRLNPTQKREKHRKKLQEDTSKEVISCVFKVADLSNSSHLFKVNINAEQYGLTGGIIMYDDCNLVIIEGGPKNTRKYTRLMLERIKWQADTRVTVPDDEDMDVEEDVESELAGSVHCSLLWKSVSNRRLFSNFKTYNCPNEMMVRKVLADKGLSHLWDLARNISSSTAA